MAWGDAPDRISVRAILPCFTRDRKLSRTQKMDAPYEFVVNGCAVELAP